MRAVRAARAIAVLLATIAVTGCGRDKPTDPSGIQPQLQSITPASLQPDTAPQIVTFAGAGFSSGLQLFVTDPAGITTTVDSAAIQGVTSGGFQATLVLNQSGIYRFAVRNPSGTASTELTTVVQPFGAVLPRVSVVTPASVPRSASQTTVLLQGENFATNSSVLVTDPNGALMILTVASLSVATPTSIQFAFAFTVRGNYTLVVTNPNGDASNPITIVVI